MPDFDRDLGKGLESFVERAVDAISRGREEILRASRIGKAKLFDLTQLRRERARLVWRLGEEAYRAMQSGTLSKDELEKTYRRVVAMDERIAAKEAEIEKIRRSGGSEARATAEDASRARAGAKRGKKRAKKRLADDEDPPE